MRTLFGDLSDLFQAHPVLVVAYALLELVGILFALKAIDTSRTSQGAIAWVGALITLPLLTVPLFVLFGQRRFEKYVHLRGKHDAETPIKDYVLERFRTFIVQPQDELGQGRVLRELSDLPFTSSNDAQLLINGEDTFKAILHSIAQARKYILFQFYILRDDDLGCRVRDALIERAAAGVSVYVLYDRIGSYGIKKSYLQTMKDAGIQVEGFKTTKGLVNKFQLNFRNHRKIVVVDGHTAFVGGHNVGDEYLGKGTKLSPWRDTHMRIEGPAVQAVQLTFVEDWRWATSVLLDLNWEPLPAANAKRVMFVLPSSPADEYETCGLFFQHAINSAKHRIWIASPYLVPDEGTLAALQLAALRGVDVRIILPGMADHRSTWLAGHSYFEEILKPKIRIFQMNEGFMHQKVMLVDDRYSVVGTANFDNRSFRLNFEISVMTIDEAFASEIHEMLKTDMRESTELTLDVVQNYSTRLRIASRTARLLSPIL